MYWNIWDSHKIFTMRKWVRGVRCRSSRRWRGRSRRCRWSPGTASSSAPRTTEPGSCSECKERNHHLLSWMRFRQNANVQRWETWDWNMYLTSYVSDHQRIWLSECIGRWMKDAVRTQFYTVEKVFWKDAIHWLMRRCGMIAQWVTRYHVHELKSKHDFSLNKKRVSHNRNHSCTFSLSLDRGGELYNW